jgi:hypothetical protein
MQLKLELTVTYEKEDGSEISRSEEAELVENLLSIIRMAKNEGMFTSDTDCVCEEIGKITKL